MCHRQKNISQLEKPGFKANEIIGLKDISCQCEKELINKYTT